MAEEQNTLAPTVWYIDEPVVSSIWTLDRTNVTTIWTKDGGAIN